jgi:hypothetical protein
MRPSGVSTDEFGTLRLEASLTSPANNRRSSGAINHDAATPLQED